MKISRDELSKIMEFFFEAALATYAAETPSVPLLTFPDCSKGYAYGNGFLRYEDHWFSNGNNSFGWTAIFLNSQPVWFMTYSGFCNDEKVLPFLKACLRRAYEQSRFCGGRGIPDVKSINYDLRYENMVNPGSDFNHFSGKEYMACLSKPAQFTLFSHEYNGRLLCEVSGMSP